MERNKKITKQVIKLFDSQINKLSSLDVPAYIITDSLIYLMEFRDKIVSRAEELDDGGFLFDLWFVPVIPFNIIGVLNQAQFLQFNDNKGYSYFDRDDINDLIITSQDPYYLWGVNENPLSSEKLVDSEKFLTLSESLALCLHKDTLCRYYIRSLNSVFRSVKESPIIHIYRGEHPKVDWDYFEDGESDIFLKEARPYCFERIF